MFYVSEEGGDEGAARACATGHESARGWRRGEGGGGDLKCVDLRFVGGRGGGGA